MAEPEYEDDHVGNPIGAAFLAILAMAALIGAVVIVFTFIPK